MARTFKALSALLGYPTTELQSSVGEIRTVLAEEHIVPRASRRALEGLLTELETEDIYDLQERYVLLFDRSRSLSLHLFEHVHGESRDRGQAMLDLAALYGRHGLIVSARELPDYLPLFLEFLSCRPVDEARLQLGEPAHIIAALADRLRRRGRPTPHFSRRWRRSPMARRPARPRSSWSILRTIRTTSPRWTPRGKRQPCASARASRPTAARRTGSLHVCGRTSATLAR
jgi:nitrate reductase molybdenum cofactor assembly chaperone